jgi:signal transduction histidine kinase
MGEAEIIIFISLISFAIVAFVIVTVALVLQYRKRKIIYEHELKIAADQHKAELMNVKMEVQEETMQHIGIEIHDSIAQKLTLASLHLQKTEYENKYKEINDTLILTSSLINESLDDLRLLSRRLLKHADEQTDIVQSIQTECDRVSQLKICSVQFDSDCNGLFLNTEIAHTVLRIVQELIQNSLKHASCQHIHVVIKGKNKQFELSVSDDGKGFESNSPSFEAGVGLKNIRNRARLIHATININSTPGKGTSTTLVISPLNTAE